MKKILICLLILAPTWSFGQRTMNDFMQENCDVIWFGLDFSKAKMIGSEGFNDPVAIKEEYFQAWNNLMVKEGEKYDWRKALVVSDLQYDYDVVDKVNDEVKVKSLVTNKSYAITEDDIATSVRQYDLSDYKDGIGVVVVVESFDKIRAQGTGYLTFFDVGTKKVIYTHQVIGDAGGFGFRNYWAKAVYNWIKYTHGRVMKDIKRKFK